MASAGDWLLSRLTGTDPVTDYTNALKTGADLVALSWPPTIESLGVPLSMLPPIVAPGTILGGVCRAASAETGLPASVNVVAGVTDANAAQIASGAVGVGNWVTTIGTGLSVKGVTVNRLVDDSGALYSHRHWNGGWIPSATSHCGAESIGRRFEGQDLEQLTRESASFPTSSVLVLPLATVGEFFPFFAPSARGFEFGAAGSRGDLFLGYLEGIAFIERMAMARFRQAGATVAGPQVTMGGGASNLRWLSLRASVLNRPVARPRQANPAFGAAIIALAGPGGEINETVRRMVSYDVVVDPVAEACARYADLFDAFLTELRRRGYVASDQTGEEF